MATIAASTCNGRRRKYYKIHTITTQHTTPSTPSNLRNTTTCNPRTTTIHILYFCMSSCASPAKSNATELTTPTATLQHSTVQQGRRGLRAITHQEQSAQISSYKYSTPSNMHSTQRPRNELFIHRVINLAPPGNLHSYCHHNLPPAGHPPTHRVEGKKSTNFTRPQPRTCNALKLND